MRSIYYDADSGPAQTLAAAERIVAAIPQHLEGSPDPRGVLRCHEVTRVVKALLRDPALRVVDGYYNENCAHSWLRHKNGWILDVYAIERLPQVQLVDEQQHVKQSYIAKRRVFEDLQAHEGGPKGYPRPSLAYV